MGSNSAAPTEPSLHPDQRNGVLLDHVLGVRMATLLLLVGEEQRALLPPLESLQRTRRGWSAEKGDPFARGHPIATPRCPSPPLLPDQPLPPLPAQEGEGTGERCLNHGVDQLTTQRPRRERVRGHPTVCIGEGNSVDVNALKAALYRSAVGELARGLRAKWRTT